MPDPLAIITREMGYDPDYLKPDHSLIGDLCWCPLDRVCVCVEIEEAFGIEIPDATMEGWETIGCILETVERRATRSQSHA